MGTTIDEQLSLIREELERIHRKLNTGRPSAFKMADAAKDLGIGLSTLKVLVRKQIILTVRIGRRRLVPQSEISRFLEVQPSDRVLKTLRKTEGDKVRAALKKKR